MSHDEFLDLLQKEGWQPRTQDECGEESSHATTCVMKCSPYSWLEYEDAERQWTRSGLEPELVPTPYLPCRSCRCGKSKGHVEGCRLFIAQKKLI